MQQTTVIADRRPVDVSIIIPAYNSASTIVEQLRALKAQVFRGSWEIIVVDNGSSDETWKIVCDHQQQMPNLLLLKAPEKKNAGYARNVGAAAARTYDLAAQSVDGTTE